MFYLDRETGERIEAESMDGGDVSFRYTFHYPYLQMSSEEFNIHYQPWEPPNFQKFQYAWSIAGCTQIQGTVFHCYFEKPWYGQIEKELKVGCYWVSVGGTKEFASLESKQMFQSKREAEMAYELACRRELLHAQEVYQKELDHVTHLYHQYRSLFLERVEY